MTNSLHLVIPLTLSGNDVLSMAYARSRKLSRYKSRCANTVCSAVISVLGYLPRTRKEFWAQKATISIIRCSGSVKAIDDDNVVIGAKYARDALVKAGVVPDDNPGRLAMELPIEDRPRGKWGEFSGPATHIIVRKVK